MPNASDLIKQLHIELAKILKAYLQPELTPWHIKLVYTWSQTLLKQCEVNPDLLFAQPQLYKTQLSYVNNLAFNACIYTCLVAARNKVDKSVIIQLTSATLSMFAIEQQQISSSKDIAELPCLSAKGKTLKKMLEKYQQPIWCNALYTWLGTHRKNTAKLNQLNSIIRIGTHFALLCTPRTNQKPVTFVKALKQLCLQSPNKWYQMLIPLLDYPSLIPTGSFIKLQDQSLHIVLFVSRRSFVIAPVEKLTDTNHNQKGTSFRLIDPDKIKQHYASQPLKNLQRLDLWWNNKLEDFVAKHSQLEKKRIFIKLQPLQAAPQSLLVIQDQLNNMNTDIKIILKAIEKDPSYVEKIKHAATACNKKTQKIITLQHGLSMLGFERANYVLLEHSLLSRLSQEYFPLQKRIMIFSELYALIAAELATKTRFISNEQAKTTAYFVISRLYTLPTIRTLHNWPINNKDHFKLENLFMIKGANTLKDGAVILAKAWQQDNIIQATLSHCDLPFSEIKTQPKLTTQFALLLGLGLIRAKQLYFPEFYTCQATKNYINSALQALSLTDIELNTAILTASTKFTFCSPLND